jgi:outer membrane lipoprotein carrier protein
VQLFRFLRLSAPILLALLAICQGIEGALPQDAVDSAKLFAHQLEEHYRNIRTLRAIFLERYSQGPHDARIESGTVYFAKPGRMRWEYESPEQHFFVSDGKTIWSYVPADRTVTRMPVKESSDFRTPLALLTGKADLSKLCGRIELAPGPPAAPDHAVLRCIPKGENVRHTPNPNGASHELDELSNSGDFTDVLIEVDKTSGQLADVQVRQPGGITIDYRFGNWRENVDLADTLFHFQAPAGVAIVDGSVPGNSIP